MKTGSTNITPRLGAIVLYTLGADEARAIIDSRSAAGRASRSGNEPRDGETYPAIIVRDWSTSDPEHRAKYERGEISDGSGRVITLAEMIAGASVNLQVFLDGNDTYWATSRTMFDPAKHIRLVDPDTRETEPDHRGHWVFPDSVIY